MIPKAPVMLRLPDDPERRKQLRQKLVEYRERFEKEPSTAVDSATKFLILHCLLQSEHGQIETRDMYAAMSSSNHDLWTILEANPIIWVNACCVIDKYCRGETDTLVDRTGLTTSGPVQGEPVSQPSATPPSERPKIITRPATQEFRGRLVEQLDRCQACLPKHKMRDLNDVVLACKILILIPLIDNETVDTHTLYIVMSKENRNLWRLIEKMPALYDTACTAVDQFCRGILRDLADPKSR